MEHISKEKHEIKNRQVEKRCATKKIIFCTQSLQSIRGGAVVADKRLGLPGGPSGAHLIPAPGIPRTTGGPAPPFRAGSIVSGFPR